MGQIEAERLLEDMKRKLLKKMDDDDLVILSSEYTSETATTASEDSAVMAVELALPEERQRIRDLLTKFPKQAETKAQKLISALGTLWSHDQSERVVVFATYLGSVEMLREEIEKAYPGLLPPVPLFFNLNGTQKSISFVSSKVELLLAFGRADIPEIPPILMLRWSLHHSPPER